MKLLAEVSHNLNVTSADKCRDTVIDQLGKVMDGESGEDDEAALNQAYAVSSYFYAEAVLEEGDVEGALRALDLGLLRGGVDVWGSVVSELLLKGEGLSGGWGAGGDAQATTLPSPVPLPSLNPPPQWLTSPKIRTISRIAASKLPPEHLLANHIELSSPVIITGLLDSWPARRLWPSPTYLKSVAGKRLVPVEVCDKKDGTQTYLSPSFRREVLPLSEYLESYVDNDDDGDGDTVAYLAQHQLFEQIQSLKGDISELSEYTSLKGKAEIDCPSACEMTERPLVSGWLGKHTVSPLHNDPYENLLCQVVGRKYLRIYPPTETGNLYPRSLDLCNNSFLDIDNFDEENYPLFRSAEGMQCMLEEGEVLYLPRHWWHYVRSMGKSFAVSMWFGAKMGLKKKVDGRYEAVY